MTENQKKQEKIIAGSILLDMKCKAIKLCEKGFDAPPWFKRIFFYYFPILLIVQWVAVFFSVRRYSLEQSSDVVIILWYAWVGGITFVSLVYGALLHLLYLDRKYKFLPKKSPHDD